MASSTDHISEPTRLLVMLGRKEDGIDDDTSGDEGFKCPMGDEWLHVQFQMIENLLRFAHVTMVLGFYEKTTTNISTNSSAQKMCDPGDNEFLLSVSIRRFGANV